jgi:hypothetical protein
MGRAMQQHGVKAGVTENDFEGTLRRRIFAEDRFKLFPDGGKHRHSGDQAGK